MDIAVLGIGAVGFPMACRLLEAGHTVHAWNRTAFQAERLRPFGATVHASAADAVRGVDTVICLLENGPVVGGVLFGQGVAYALKPGALVIDMSSIQPTEARDHAARLSEIGAPHLDAPVSGGTLGAKSGTHRCDGGRASQCVRARQTRAGGVRTCHSYGAAWLRPTGQIGEPDDCGYHHRRNRRGPAAV